MMVALAVNAGVRPVILLVEDHFDTRQMYAEFLGGQFEILEAGDGRQGLEVMKARRPAVLITDLSLPGLDGFELVALVRQDPELASIPIICLSGYGGHAYEAQARAAGCDMLLQKPCMPDALSDAVLELLNRRA